MTPPVAPLAPLSVDPLALGAQSAQHNAQSAATGRSAGAASGIDASAAEFEALFIGQMLKPMFEGLSTDGPFGGGHAEKTWRGFFVEALGREIAKGGGLGLADAVRQALLDAGGPGRAGGPDAKET